MPLFVIGCILLLVGIAALAFGFFARRAKTRLLEEAAAASDDGDRYTKSARQRLTEDASGARLWSLIAFGVSVLFILLGLLFVHLSTYWSNGQGESKIQVNSITREWDRDNVIQGPGAGWRAPWIEFVEYDNAYQELVYAGGDTPPSYTGGTVNGKEITVTVGGIKGGSTQGDSDATFVYNLDPDAIVAIYEKYPYPDSQARFTKAIIEKQTLNLARQQSEYSAVEFRGARQAEAQEKLQERLNKVLGSYGVEFTSITFQWTRYSKEVEAALSAVEVANQKQIEAEANLRATEVSAQAQIVEAEAKAKALVVAAEGEAEANRKIAASLTPEVLQAKLIDAYDEGTVYVTDGNADVLLGAK